MPTLLGISRGRVRVPDGAGGGSGALSNPLVVETGYRIGFCLNWDLPGARTDDRIEVDALDWRRK